MTFAKFSFMEEWKTIHISDIGKIVTGKTPRTSIAENYGGRIPFLTPSDDLSGKYAPHSAKTLTNLGLAEVKNCLLPDHAICVSCIGSDLGKVVMTKQPTVTNQQFNSIIPNADFDPDFVYYLMTIVGKKLNYLSKTSTAVPIVNKSSFSAFEVSVPPLHEQKRIARILSSFDDIIALNNRINHNLEEQIQERFDSMIISDNGLGYCQIADYVDVNPKRSLRKNEPAKCVDMSYLSTTGPFPSGWETKGYNGGMKFFNGDTIMARITPCLENGKVAYVNFLDDGETAFGSTEFIVLHAKEGVDPVFTYFLVRNKNFVDYATKNMNGSSGRQRVSGDTIGKYMIPVIDSHSLNEFSGFATPAMEVIRNNSFESRSLAATRDALLPLLLSGELSISQMNC